MWLAHCMDFQERQVSCPTFRNVWNKLTNQLVSVSMTKTPVPPEQWERWEGNLGSGVNSQRMEIFHALIRMQMHGIYDLGVLNSLISYLLCVRTCFDLKVEHCHSHLSWGCVQASDSCISHRAAERTVHKWNSVQCSEGWYEAMVYDIVIYLTLWNFMGY